MPTLLTNRSTLELLILEEAELGIPAPDTAVKKQDEAIRRAAMSELISKGFLELCDKNWVLTEPGKRELETIRKQALIVSRSILRNN